MRDDSEGTMIITQQHAVLRPGIVRRDERTVRRFGPPFGIASTRFCSQNSNYCNWLVPLTDERA
jgi:hypothetical protein